ncbi:CadC family transcriptional regulator, partial [Candidatus Bathyarchaeota archaeon]|nr:CadC family transcriptional regulator [Candidatus Bathyarchaeota archaeon]
MCSTGHDPLRLVFESFELDLKSGELRKAGRRIKLPPQPSKVLMLLASRSGELVSREELQQQIWRNDTFVDFEQGLGFCIRQIRMALGDDAHTPRYIETIP